jgi:prepilin-type N-terminal cleavage/methylation domain-containing protein
MKQQGFTLTELITTTVIILLTSIIGVGEFNSLLQETKAKSGFLSLLQQANSTRQLAINNSQPAVLCPSNNQKDCVNDWKAPKMIFLDSNNNRKRDNNENIKNLFSAVLDQDIQIKYPKTQIRFDEQGIANFYNGTLAYCMNNIIKGLVISRPGRIRIAQDLNGDGTPDISPSKPVSCD